ncbi:MAG TPA: hypothetical protein VGK24_13705 [Candidatus Angelobacter sp.]|jgi:hypothetical protein
MEETRAGGQDRSQALQGQVVEERHGYYRPCQRFRKNGQQCKAPAMKGADQCYKHQEQADIEQRRRKQFTLPPLVDLKTVQRAIGDVMQALLKDRIDEEYAGELLQTLQNASIRLRLGGGGDDHPAVAFMVNDLALL